jgi:hypothetical protein
VTPVTHLCAPLEFPGGGSRSAAWRPGRPLAGVVHIQLADGSEIDVILATWQWAAGVIERAEPMRIAGIDVRVPRTSDLILLKLAAGGYLDLRNAAALLATGDRDVLVREVDVAQTAGLRRQQALGVEADERRVVLVDAVHRHTIRRGARRVGERPPPADVRLVQESPIWW